MPLHQLWMRWKPVFPLIYGDSFLGGKDDLQVMEMDFHFSEQ